MILNWSYESVYGRLITHKAEAKICAQIEEVTFVVTIQLCCTRISNHDGATVCTSLNGLPSFRQCIFLTFLLERAAWFCSDRRSDSFMPATPACSLKQPAIWYTSVSQDCPNPCSVPFVLHDLQIEQAIHGLSAQAQICALSSPIHGLSTSTVCA